MHTVVTITFSPCLDKSILAPFFQPDMKIRCSSYKMEAGGGGINVARAIKKLGGEARAIFPAGGYNGMLLEDLLEKEKVPTVKIEIGVQPRENIIIYDESSHKQYRFVMPGEALHETEWMQCLQAVEELDDIGFIVASGSLPPGVPLDIYARLARVAKKINAKLVVDTSGEPLRHAVEEGVFLLKPNLNELKQLMGKKEMNLYEAKQAAEEIIKVGRCENLLVSMGSDGAMLVTKEFTEIISSPPMECKSTVGAGDSLVAGLVYYLSLGKKILEAAQYAVACGTAATIRPGTELCQKEEADHLYEIISKKSLLLE